MPQGGLSRLTSEQRRWLLDLARTTIVRRLQGVPSNLAGPVDGPLAKVRGAFVTLTTDDGALRGCVGHVIGSEALWRSVEVNAVNAAFHDPRFSPVGVDEIDQLVLEISALSALVAVAKVDEIRVGRDGLIVERGGYRGLLLPQVAERYGWSAAEFLDQTCRKAGMRPGCWQDPATLIRRFTAEVFSERDET